MSIHESIEKKLTESLSPIRLDVINESNLHKGHPGIDGKRETHFRVEVVSDAFTGKGQVARQRMVYALLDEEMKGGLHALTLTTLAPGD